MAVVSCWTSLANRWRLISRCVWSSHPALCLGEEKLLGALEIFPIQVEPGVS